MFVDLKQPKHLEKLKGVEELRLGLQIYMSQGV